MLLALTRLIQKIPPGPPFSKGGSQAEQTLARVVRSAGLAAEAAAWLADRAMMEALG